MDVDSVLFDGWSGVVRTAVLASMGYVGLLVLLRISGKRAVAKMSLFDFVFAVAMGSTLAATILGSGNTLAEGMAALAVLLFIHFLFSLAAVHFAGVQAVITGEPALLVRNGRILHDALRRERLTEEQVRAGIRGHGVARLEDVAVVVMETDGSFSVIVNERARGELTAMHDVRNPARE